MKKSATMVYSRYLTCTLDENRGFFLVELSNNLVHILMSLLANFLPREILFI